MKQIKLEDDPQDEIREFLLKTMSLKEKQLDFDLFFNTISPSLKNKVQSNSFRDKLMLNLTINRLLVVFKSRSIKEMRKQALISPSEMLMQTSRLPCFRKKLENFTVDTEMIYSFDEHLMHSIIDKMVTQFAGPEEEVVK